MEKTHEEKTSQKQQQLPACSRFVKEGFFRPKTVACTELARQNRERNITQMLGTACCGGVMGAPVARPTVENEGLKASKTVLKDL